MFWYSKFHENNLYSYWGSEESALIVKEIDMITMKKKHKNTNIPKRFESNKIMITI